MRYIYIISKQKEISMIKLRYINIYVISKQKRDYYDKVVHINTQNILKNFFLFVCKFFFINSLIY